MGRIQEMMFPFMIILFAVNAMFLFMIYLPTSQVETLDGTVHNTFRINESQFEVLSNFAQNVQGDANNLASQDIFSGSANTTERTLPTPLTNILYGLIGGVGGCIIGALGGGAIGCVTVGVSLGLLGYFWQYFSFLAFGFWVWIDLFISPTWGAGFLFLNLALKGVFFIVMLVGLSGFLLQFFSAWRK